MSIEDMETITKNKILKESGIRIMWLITSCCIAQ